MQTTDRRAVKLHSALDELLVRYDELAAIGAETRDHARVKSLIDDLEARVVALVRPRHWRFRDLKTAGVRDLSAAGVTLHEGKLQYGDHVWPANWSYAGLEPGSNPGARVLFIKRVMLKSPVPLQKSVEPGRWTETVADPDLDDALILVACINVSSRMRLATFPVGTFF